MTIPDRLLENRAIQCLKDIDFSYFQQPNQINSNNKYASAAITDLVFNTSFIAKHYEFSYHLYKNNEFQIIYIDKEGKQLDVPIQDIHKEKVLSLLHKVQNIYSNKELFEIENTTRHFNSENMQLYKNKLQFFSLEEFKIFIDKLTLHKADFFSKKSQSMLNFSVENNKLFINQVEYNPTNINSPHFLLSPFDLKEDLLIKLNNKEYSYDEFNQFMNNKPLKQKIKP